MRLVIAWLRLSRRKAMYQSAEQLHARMQAAAPAAPPHSDAQLHVHTIAAPEGWQCTQLQPAQASARRPACWLYLHGGAYVFPITAWHWRMLRKLVLHSGCTVLVAQYPRAPHATCTATIAALQNAVPEWMAAHPRWGVMGDSAGAGMALALSLAQRDAAQPMAQQLLLITPWLDVELADADCQRIAPQDPMLALEGARAAGRLYAGDLPTSHPWCSPVNAALHQLPPLHIWCAKHDVCTPATLRLAERARQAGTTTHLYHGAHMVHAWPLLPTAEGHAAQRELAMHMRALGEPTAVAFRS